MDVTEKENVSEVHQFIVRGQSKAEMQDKVSNFFLEHGTSLRVLDVIIKDNIAKIIYEWSVRLKNAD
jgi:hypothetical protein